MALQQVLKNIAKSVGMDRKSLEDRAAALSILESQISKTNDALGNKNWTGSWGGGGSSAVKDAAVKLYQKGVRNLSDLEVRPIESQDPEGDQFSLVNKLDGKVIQTSPTKNFAIDTYDTGNFFKGKDKTFGIAFSEDGYAIPYQTTQRSGLVYSPILPIAAAFIPGVGPAIGAALGASGAAATVLGNAVLQGTLAEAQGGDFLKGAALSAIGGTVVPNVTSGLSNALGGGAAANIASNALTGGVMAELSGGDFARGALMSGVGSGINEAKLSAASDYLDSLPGGYGEYSDALPDMSDFDLPPAVIDTSFTPDYSLSTGRPVIPDMGAQGIQVPTINEVVDVVNQPVDYSLPITNSGLGFQMPTAPNLDSMGGGQGITVPVSGGTLAETGVIPDTFVPDLGDPNSFINQPVPNVSVNIPELPATTPKDIDTELGLLNAAKNLAPVVVGSLLADKVLGQADQKTGFDIVPIPGNWRSPEYNQAFTPSEAIDFGNAGMLAGTQFARQPQAATPSFYNLSDVINTLNFQSVPFAQQQLQMPQQSLSMPDILQQFQTPSSMSMNDFIGEIDGTPMSLNSIIAGIQSQYG